MVAHPLKVVLLDLDGTLTESAPGILASVRKTFEAIEMPVPDEHELQQFIGPAIVDSLKRNHVPEDKMPLAVDTYRSYYSDRPAFDDPNEPGAKVPGKLVNVMYPGIIDQLRRLRSSGYYLAIATCKPEYQAIPICEHFHLSEEVDGIYGASRDMTRLNKDQVIRYAFESIGFDESVGDVAIMVGDRWTDVDGANAVGIASIGCNWGYANPGELKEHGVTMTIDAVDDLSTATDSLFSSISRSGKDDTRNKADKVLTEQE
ncbi:MAG: HAD hydrolase-like protein [Bifidobacterium sp.]|uniref:HAD hydrolase-like protein n=1 Tax=Bifidobacterium fermentum TaxID=3059035 RepID=A0AB39UE65_9BIFI